MKSCSLFLELLKSGGGAERRGGGEGERLFPRGSGSFVSYRSPSARPSPPDAARTRAHANTQERINLPKICVHTTCFLRTCAIVHAHSHTHSLTHRVLLCVEHKEEPLRPSSTRYDILMAVPVLSCFQGLTAPVYIFEKEDPEGPDNMSDALGSVRVRVCACVQVFVGGQGYGR